MTLLHDLEAMDLSRTALIGCEESGVVRRAFAAVGLDVWSCDLLPAADCFRKVIPRADEAERCDAAFLEQVKQGCVPADGAR